jgi:hypothetical protein
MNAHSKFRKTLPGSHTKGQLNTLLSVGDVFANELSLDPVRALGHFRRQEARSVASKEQSWINVRSNVGAVAMVVRGEDLFAVTNSEMRLLYV